VVIAAACAGLAFGPALADSPCAPPTAGPPVCLSGTITSPGANVAMIEEAGHTGVSGLRLGDTVNDWQIVEITPKYIKLNKAGETATVEVVAPAALAAPAPVPTTLRPPIGRSLRRRGDPVVLPPG
jgi:hypothetical protein